MTTFLQSLTGLTLLDPWMLWLLLLVPAALVARRWSGRPAVLFAPAPILHRAGPGGMPSTWRTWLLPLPRTLQLLAVLLVGFCLARPMQRVRMPLERQGIDIILCLDTSSSMVANDLDPDRSRLELSKQAAADFVTGRSEDRIGIVRFARYPDLLCPLTLDHRAVTGFLADLEMVEPDGMEDLTGIGTAVARAAQILQASTAPSKVVILLTDGEENVATEQTPEEIGPLRAGLLCEQLGVRVYAISAGIGKRDPAGEWVPLETGHLRRLAEMTGGTFYEARDASAIVDVYRTIDQLETVPFQEPRYELRDAFLPFLLAALGLSLTGRLLNASVLEVLP